jgi:hypothetical protein
MSDSEDEIIAVGAAMLAKGLVSCMNIFLEHQSSRKRRWGVHPINQKRNSLGKNYNFYFCNIISH